MVPSLNSLVVRFDSVTEPDSVRKNGSAASIFAKVHYLRLSRILTGFAIAFL